jgi:hypothetical protein
VVIALALVMTAILIALVLFGALRRRAANECEASDDGVLLL